MWDKAVQVRENAYVPYSEFAVGAALLTVSNKIYTGCNIENAAYGLTICAERTAIFKAVSEGNRDFRALLIVSEGEKLSPPCGSCRQVIYEFEEDIEIILSNLDKELFHTSIKELLPNAFNKRDLEL